MMGSDGMQAAPEETPQRRARPKPGERRLQILQVLATMLEQPQGDRVTTAALAARLGLSEAALYRQFASKAQMYEGLIEFIETSLFSLINQIQAGTPDGLVQVRSILEMLLRFAHRNPGMTRVLSGDALIHEDERLSDRINQLLDRVELSLKQSYRTAIQQHQQDAVVEAGVRANLAMSYVVGRWSRFVRTGFRRQPVVDAEVHIQLLTLG